MKSKCVEPPSWLTIDLLNRSGSDMDTDSLERGVRMALLAYGVIEGSVCVLLTSDEEVQELNREHRSIDEPTDVLTFPSATNNMQHIGDIAIAVPFAFRQAEQRSVCLATEIAYLGIHGALHLAGLDDETDEECVVMQREMARIAALVGLPPDPDWTSLSQSEVMERTR